MSAGSTAGRVKAAPPLWRGILMLLGGFAGLCTLFALIATALGAWQEHREAQWPQTTARVEKCRLRAASSRRGSGYYIDCVLSYEVGEGKYRARVHSASVPAPDRVIWQYPPRQFERLEEWVDAHPEGTPIVVHYDPANPGKVALVVTDMPGGGPRTPSNLRVLGVFAVACAALLGVARIGR